MNDWVFYLVILVTGIVSGFINMLAGSGSFITLPVLIYFFSLNGIAEPTKLANGTKRVAILLQNAMGTYTFNQNKLIDWKGVLYLAPSTIIGSILGSIIAVQIDEDALNKIIGIIMLFMIVLTFKNPKKWLEGEIQRIEKRPKVLVFILFFFIGIYGGFIQAGVGIFFLISLVLGIGYNVVRANAVKVAINFFMTISSIVIFALNDSIDLKVGLVLSVGSVIGARLGTKFAIKKGTQWIRVILVVVMIISSLYLLDVYKYFY